MNPFGKMVEVSLTHDEEEIVASGVSEKVWEEVVLKKLYRPEGERRNGSRAGHWTFCDSSGKKAYEGDYLQGQRDGKWIYYYEIGKTRAELMYKQGELNGQCRYYDYEGKCIDSVSWKGDHPVDRTVQEVGLARTEARGPGGVSVSAGGTRSGLSQSAIATPHTELGSWSASGCLVTRSSIGPLVP